MNGIELSRAYFEQFGLPMLLEQFPEALPYLAAGLCVCFGVDDASGKLPVNLPALDGSYAITDEILYENNY